MNIPTTVFPTVVGQPILRYDDSLSSSSVSGTTTDGPASSSSIGTMVYGTEATNNRQHLELTYPIENGIIKNWDDMTAIWNYAFHSQLGLDSLRHDKILLTEPPMNPRKNREK